MLHFEGSSRVDGAQRIVMQQLRVLPKLFAALVCAGAFPAFALDMFSPSLRPKAQVIEPRLAAAERHSHAVRYNADALLAMAPGDEVKVNLPNGRAYAATFERRVAYESGSRSWVGYLTELGKDYRVITTTGANGGTYGTILTPEGEFLIAPAKGGDLLIDATSLQMEMPLERPIQDWVEPPLSEIGFPRAKVDPVCPEITSRPTPLVTVDVMFVYAPDWEASHGAANVITRMDALITRINQTYVDSNIAMQLRRVHQVRVDYGSAAAVSDQTALNDITELSSRGGRGAGVFANIVDLRNQFGADMVAFMRGPQGGNSISGLAWIGGSQQSDIANSVNLMYSINGDSPVFGGLLVAHELGHNMGNQHDRPNAGSNNGATAIGVTSYSYGHVVCGTGADAQCGTAAGFWNTGSGFGTVMAYPLPTVGKFSSPNLQCRGNRTASVEGVCGVAAGLAGAADNVRSMNCVRQKLAAMKPTQIADTSVPSIGLNAGTATTGNGPSTLNVAVTRAGNLNAAVTVQFATANITAIAGTDYTPTSGTLSFASGEASKSIPIAILASNNAADRTFRVTLSNPTGPAGTTLGIITATTITIRGPGLFPPNGQLPAGWTQPVGANTTWAVATDQAFEGTFSLKSRPTGDSQRAQIQFVGDFTAGNITFARKVSSEQNFDFFRVSIDGVVQAAANASGELDWTNVTLPIAAGRRTVMFSYEKDADTVRGSDAAWIDAVVFPLATGPCASNPTGDDDADGIPNCVESAEGRNASVKDNDVFTINRLYVMQLYRDVLAREGSAGDITSWTNELAAGRQTRASLAAAFLTVAEVQNLDSPMVRLYAATYLRIPDFPGLQFWTNEFRNGRSLVNIASAFATAPEFVATYGNLNNRDYVNRLYTNILGRTADQAGSDFWTGRIDRGEESRGSMLMQFSESVEYRNGTANAVLATLVYTKLLRRSPAQAEQDALRNGLSGGQALANLVNSNVLTSAAYRQRFLP
jgi:hypothetical protein